MNWRGLAVFVFAVCLAGFAAFAVVAPWMLQNIRQNIHPVKPPGAIDRPLVKTITQPESVRVSIGDSITLYDGGGRVVDRFFQPAGRVLMADGRIIYYYTRREAVGHGDTMNVAVKYENWTMPVRKVPVLGWRKVRAEL